MTDREKVVVMAYTGVAMVQGDKLNLFYDYLAELFGRPVFSHEIGILAEEIKERSKPDFLRICVGEDPEDRRGEWIQDDDLSFDPVRPWWYCSHCGERTGIKTKYCPECGFRNLRAGE